MDDFFQIKICKQLIQLHRDTRNKIKNIDRANTVSKMNGLYLVGLNSLFGNTCKAKSLYLMIHVRSDEK